MTLRRQNYRFCHFCSGSVYIEKEFSKNIFMSMIPIPVQTKLHFKILELFGVTFDVRYLPLCYTYGLDGNGLFSVLK